MVRTTPIKTRTRTTPRTTRRTPRQMPAAVMPPLPVVEARARFAVAERRLMRAGRTAARFARNSTREVMAAAQAMREPMQSMVRTMRRASRNIARDAMAAWHDLVPMPALKPMRAGRSA